MSSSEEQEWGDYGSSEDGSGSDDGSGSENEVENIFYEAEDIKNDDFKEAIKKYQIAIQME